jgi:hypothetical protein
MTTTAEAGASAGDEVDQECGVCGEGPYARWGAFLGEHTLDTGSEIQGWMWAYEAGRMVFLADAHGDAETAHSEICFILDTHRRVPYCGGCADELRSDQGLPPSARLTVFAS